MTVAIGTGNKLSQRIQRSCESLGLVSKAELRSRIGFPPPYGLGVELYERTGGCF
jgi:hypothetical protein